MTKKGKIILTAFVSVMLVCALGIGICLLSAQATPDPTLSTKSGAESAGYTIKVGNYMASEYATTAGGERVYKVYCDNCHGSGRLGGTNVVCPKDCHFSAPYRLSGAWVECGECDGTGSIGSKDCAGCAGSGRTGQYWQPCATCSGKSFVTLEKTDCGICTGKGYFWMKGDKVLDCASCQGFGTLLSVKYVDCDDCHHVYQGKAGNWTRCDDCDGSGEKICERCDGNGYTRYRGNGQWWKENHACEACGGHGVTSVWGSDYHAGTGKVACECKDSEYAGFVWETCDECDGAGMLTLKSFGGTCAVCAGAGWYEATSGSTQPVAIQKPCADCVGGIVKTEIVSNVEKCADCKWIDAIKAYGSYHLCDECDGSGKIWDGTYGKHSGGDSVNNYFVEPGSKTVYAHPCVYCGYKFQNVEKECSQNKNYTTCDECDGTGKVLSVCPTCGGDGQKDVIRNTTCATCDGHGWEEYIPDGVIIIHPTEGTGESAGDGEGSAGAGDANQGDSSADSSSDDDIFIIHPFEDEDEDFVITPIVDETPVITPIEDDDDEDDGFSGFYRPTGPSFSRG